MSGPRAAGLDTLAAEVRTNSGVTLDTRAGWASLTHGARPSVTVTAAMVSGPKGASGMAGSAGTAASGMVPSVTPQVTVMAEASHTAWDMASGTRSHTAPETDTDSIRTVSITVMATTLLSAFMTRTIPGTAAMDSPPIRRTFRSMSNKTSRSLAGHTFRRSRASFLNKPRKLGQDRREAASMCLHFRMASAFPVLS